MGRLENATRDKIAREASVWVVRLADPNAAPDQTRAFEAWRSQSPRHDVAYERAAAIWRRLDRLQALGQGSSKIDPDLLAPRTPRKLHWPSARPLQWAAAAASVAAVLAGAVAANVWASPAYASGVGERRLVLLADGTQAELNTNSKIVVHFRHGKREVVVVRGEVLFKIVDQTRPFIVIAKHASVQTQRAELDVRIRTGAADIVMRQGDATVTAQPVAFVQDGAPPRRLLSNTDAEAGPGGVSVRQIPSAEVDRVLAWRQGGIELSGQTLAQAVEEFNRYNRRQLVVADASISTLRLAGYFQCDDLPGFVGAVTAAFPVNVAQDDPNRILLSRRRGGA